MKLNPLSSTGHWPVPSGNPPLETGKAADSKASVSSSDALPVPSGQRQEGTTGSPVLPILTSEFALNGKNVVSLAAGQAGTIFAGTRGGELWQLQGANWKAQTNYSKPRAITAIVQEKDGALWVGTDGDGLYRSKNGASAHFDKSQGLLSDSIRALHLDSHGVLWIGTTGGGLSRWREERIANFTAHEGLPDNTISQILEDDDKRLWLGSNRGIVCVSKRDLEELAAGKIAVIYPQA